MAFPSSGFAYATGALASSGYSDGVLVVDLSELPADWWNAIDTADTTKARFGIGGTEVAGWIDPETFVNNMDGTGEGIAYIYYSSVSAVTGQVAGIQPPKAANDSYAAGDTYGRNAVRAHADAWYPMTEDPSGGSILDATGNGNTGTVVGSLTSAGAAGIEFPGTNGNAIEIPDLVNGSGAWTVAARFNASDLSLIGGLGRRIFNSTGDSGNIEADLNVSSNFRAYIYQYGYAFNLTAGSPSTATDYWAEFSWGDDGASLTINGTEIASSASTTGISGATKTFIGGAWVQGAGQPEGAFDGVIGGVAIYPFSRPAAARAHSYANESDPATFWGTWTWTPFVGMSADVATLVESSTGNTVVLTGTNTAWTPGTPGSPTFTISTTGSGAAITAQTIDSPTQATLTIDAGTAATDVLTITDPDNSITADITLVAAASGSLLKTLMNHGLYVGSYM